MAKSETTTTDTDVTAADVRAWARSKGMEVGARGRIHPDVIAAYNKGRKGPNQYVRPVEAPRTRRNAEELVSA